MDKAGGARIGWASLLGVICIWSGFILITRHSTTGALTSWDIGMLRFGVGALVSVCFLPFIALPAPRVIALFSLFGGVGYALVVYAAFHMSPAAHASILLPGTLPFATAMIAWLWLGQKPLPLHLAALASVFAGVMMTAADSLSQGPRLTLTQITGDVLFFCGSLSWGVFTLLLGRYSVQPLAAAVTTTLGSAMLYLPIWWLFLPTGLMQASMPEIVMQAVYQGVLVVFISMMLYSVAIDRLGPHTVALQITFVPVISSLLAVPILGETISVLEWGGLVAVTAGALLGARASGRAFNQYG
ncbi:MAG TPA: DMT family transporter [Nitrosospira sp.]|nr:DMT family transporter [Nitrosospira sp.]